jgi:hypothetical protein
MLRVYPVEEDAIITPDKLVFKSIQPMIQEECVLRVYVVKGVELQAKDSNGKVFYLA